MVDNRHYFYFEFPRKCDFSKIIQIQKLFTKILSLWHFMNPIMTNLSKILLMNKNFSILNKIWLLCHMYKLCGRIEFKCIHDAWI